jgi:GDPmannose 4,6-dehydratase
MGKRALITGINGMDGSHLADFLLSKGYEVFGMERTESEENRLNSSHLIGKINFLKGDLSDGTSLLKCIKDSKPDEIYNFAAQSFVGDSWNTPESQANITGLGVLRLLDAIREYGDKNVRFYQASSSEMFGKMYENPVKETTPFYPKSPYAVAKLYGHWITKNYRESYGMYNCSGMAFNHESERRGLRFVVRKITNGIAKIHLGLSDEITLGNIKIAKDWGYSPDYVEGMWLMLQQDEPDDYILSTGISRTIEDLLNIAFEMIGINDWSKHIKIDPKFIRPVEMDAIKGDYNKAKEKLGWQPKTSFEDMIKIMVQNDINLLKNTK